MGALLIFVAPMFPLVCVAKLFAALVLFEVSAASVVVALNVVPAEASREDKPMKRMIDSPNFRTHTPRL